MDYPFGCATDSPFYRAIAYFLVLAYTGTVVRYNTYNYTRAGLGRKMFRAACTERKQESLFKTHFPHGKGQ